jgi:hypothetical protein
LGGELITEKRGSLVDNLEVTDFVVAKKIYATPERTVVQNMNPLNPKLGELIDTLKKDFEKDKGNKEAERRLSSLTNGVVTIYVGGQTPIEMQENIFRYEDAINATRAAMRDGYLIGGGLSLFNATRDENEKIFLTCQRYPFSARFALAIPPCRSGCISRELRLRNARTEPSESQVATRVSSPA